MAAAAASSASTKAATPATTPATTPTAAATTSATTTAGKDDGSSKSKPLLVFGYGSLMSKWSANRSFPVSRFRMASIHGFKRVFSLVSISLIKSGIVKSTDCEAAAVAVRHTGNKDDVVVGAVLDIHAECEAEYRRREARYTFMKTEATILEGGEPWESGSVLALVCVESDDDAVRAQYATPEAFHDAIGKWYDGRLWGRADVLPCRKYLRLCAKAAWQLGGEAYLSFVSRSFLVDGSTTIAQFMASHAAWYPELAAPIMCFVGVNTQGSAIRPAFDALLQQLNICAPPPAAGTGAGAGAGSAGADAGAVGAGGGSGASVAKAAASEPSHRPRLLCVDLPLDVATKRMRRVMNAIMCTPPAGVRGALVTSHKLRAFQCCKDLFTHADLQAALCRESSVIRKAPTAKSCCVAAHAPDCAAAAVCMQRMLQERMPGGYWQKHPKAQVVILGLGGAGTAIAAHLVNAIGCSLAPVVPTPKLSASLASVKYLPASRRPAAIHLVDVDPAQLQRFKDTMACVGCFTEVSETILLHTARSPVDVDALLKAMPPHSLIVNATGMGKDVPGSPVSPAVLFPERSIVWELNYRGERTFMHQALEQRATRGVQVFDGWDMFIVGWSTALQLTLGSSDCTDTTTALSNLNDAALRQASRVVATAAKRAPVPGVRSWVDPASEVADGLSGLLGPGAHTYK